MRLHLVSRLIPVGVSILALPFSGLLSRQIAKLFVDLYRSLPAGDDVAGRSLPFVTQVLIAGQAESRGILLALFLLTFLSLSALLLIQFRVSDSATRATGVIWVMGTTNAIGIWLIGSTLVAGMMPLMSGPIIQASAW